MGGVFTKLISANTTIPTKKSEVFSTAVDNQPSVEIHVLQGERSMAKDNKTIGKFHLDGFPPSRRGVPQIEVTFDIDANGIINVSALDKATNKTQSIRIESSSGLSKEEIEKMKMDAEQNAEIDKKLKEDADTLNSADSMIFQVSKSLEDLKDKISDEDKENITSKIENLKTAYNEKNIENIKSLMDEVNNEFQKISQNLYNQASESSDNEEEVTNVDFEEVK
jgi:molecular chaperone DnaK